MRITFKEKHRYAIRLKFGDKFLTSITKLVLEEKFRTSSTIKKKLLYCLKFSAFVVIVII